MTADNSMKKGMFMHPVKYVYYTICLTGWLDYNE